MKKFGFTLAELLIALSIIAIASALMAPAITNVMPDKYKTRVLKYYAMVANATNDMLENEAIYYTPVDRDGNPTCVGLECMDQPLIAPYNDARYSALFKYRNILADMLDLEQIGDSTYSTPDGTRWWFRSQFIAERGFQTTIRLTFDNRDNGNCQFPDCQSPNTPNVYVFRVDKEGAVSPGDALTDAYLHNPTGRDKKADKDLARSYLDSGKTY